MNDRNDLLSIDIGKLLLSYLRRWWLILLVAVMGAAAAFSYSYFYVVPQYRASTTIYVNNLKEGASVDSVTTGNLSASQQLVNTYIRIVKSNRVMEKASAALNGEYSVSRLQGMVTASQLGETEIFAIYVTGPNPEETARIANTLAAVVPEEIGTLIEGSSARVIDTAKVPTFRCSPSYRKSVVLGGAVGGFLVVAILTLVFLLDVRIKDEEELTSAFDFPVLGQIPDFGDYSSKSHSYGYGKSKNHYETEKASKDLTTADGMKAAHDAVEKTNNGGTQKK